MDFKYSLYLCLLKEFRTMKTLDQIYRYTSDCRFPDDDWQMILAYCRERFKGGKIHKALYPIGQSTYDQFLDWIDNGFGSGDMVGYGKTMGIVKNCVPERIELAAYCDYEGNLIVKDMVVMEPQRIYPLERERCVEFRKLMTNKGIDFSVRLGKTCELYIPKENYYVTLGDDSGGKSDVGMYLESDGCSHHFMAFLSKGELKMDCWVKAECTPLRQASDKDIQRLHHATAKAGWSFNERTKKFVKLAQKKRNNHYWYLNDRFEIVSDVDNGTKKHSERYDAGNYFSDQTEALMFMKAVKAMVEKERAL